MSARPTPSRSRAALFGVVGSLLVHGAGWVWAGAFSVPDPGFRWRLPGEVEFGVAEPVEASLPGTAAPAEPAPPPEPDAPAEAEPPAEAAPPPEAGQEDDRDDAAAADAGPPDAGPPDAGPLDAGPPDAGVPDAAPTPDAVADAGPLDEGPPDAATGDAGVGAAARLDGGVADAGPADGSAPTDAAFDAGTDRDAEVVDGGVPDAAVARALDGGPVDAGRGDGAVADAGAPDGGDADAGRGTGGRGVAAPGDGPAPRRYRLPAGAQLALRLDLAAIRDLALADDASRLLASLPDWRALLEGSGVDPVRDLDRLMVATPTLRRSRTLVAGRVEGGPDRVREAVRALAAHRGRPAEWSNRDGVPTAPWHDRDRTERIAALLGGRTFSITRPSDLPRLLAVARARSDEGEAPGQAILSMPAGAVVTFEAEGARAYAQGPLVSRVPTSLRATLSPADEDAYALEIVGEYPDEGEAREAAAWLGDTLERLARNPLAAAFGLAGPLARARLTLDAGVLRVETTLRDVELRALLRTGAQAVGGPP